MRRSCPDRVGAGGEYDSAQWIRLLRTVNPSLRGGCFLLPVAELVTAPRPHVGGAVVNELEAASMLQLIESDKKLRNTARRAARFEPATRTRTDARRIQRAPRRIGNRLSWPRANRLLFDEHAAINDSAPSLPENERRPK